MVTDTIRKIFELTDSLEQQYSGQHFTPDGHMLGSIGEVYAAERYNLTLYQGMKHMDASVIHPVEW